MNFIIDTNVLSELRRKDKMNAGVREWFASVSSYSLFLSVLTLGEIRSGIEKKRLTDEPQAEALETWLQQSMLLFGTQILPITRNIANRWGHIAPGKQVPDVDGLIAATALEHGLVVVTRNLKDFKLTGARTLNPFR
jgi:predicted nucleic acid-binding protein